MSLDELISIERVEFQTTKERIQETYVVTNLLLSKLFEEILQELEMDILPILDVKILAYSLRSVPFTMEAEGVDVLESFNECMDSQLYGRSHRWNCNVISTKIKRLQQLVLWDYEIEGSLKVYYDNRIEWDLGVSIIVR